MNTHISNYRRQQVTTIGTMYVGYAMSMVLRMIPTVAGTSIREEASLGIDLESWGKVLAAGTCGALAGKFLCGWAADKFGGKRTFTIALFVASLFVGLFAMSSSLIMFQATFFVTLMAQAAGWPSMTKIIVNWVTPKQYGRVWGILSTSSRVGTLTATFVLGSMLAWISWRGMLWIAAATGMESRPGSLWVIVLVRLSVCHPVLGWCLNLYALASLTTGPSQIRTCAVNAYGSQISPACCTP